MQRRQQIRIAVQCLAMLGLSYGALAQQPAPAAPAGGGRQGGAAPARAGRPPLFFREEWKQVPGGGEHPITADAVASANLELKLYGTSSKEIQLTGSAQDDNNPIHLWTGLCTTPCAAALKDKNNYVDLSGLGRIRWVTKTSGFHQVRPIVKLADGTWLVGDRADGSPVDWLMNDIALSEVRWLKLDVASVVTKGNFVEKPDLSKVDEVGFADLLPGSGHGAGGWSDVAVIEVYGKPVKRQ
jgi:hypothetical protein